MVGNGFFNTSEKSISDGRKVAEVPTLLTLACSDLIEESDINLVSAQQLLGDLMLYLDVKGEL